MSASSRILFIGGTERENTLALYPKNRGETRRIQREDRAVQGEISKNAMASREKREGQQDKERKLNCIQLSEPAAQCDHTKEFEGRARKERKGEKIGQRDRRRKDRDRKGDGDRAHTGGAGAIRPIGCILEGKVRQLRKIPSLGEVMHLHAG